MINRISASLRRFARRYPWPCLIAVLVCFGCTALEEPDADAVLTVGSRRVGLEELKRDMAYVSPGAGPSGLPRGDALALLLDRVIERYLIMEYAAEIGISISDEELARALAVFEGEDGAPAFEESLLKAYVAAGEWENRLRERLVAEKVLQRVTAGVPPPSYEDIRTYFKENRRSFHQPEKVRFRQIVTRTREEAEALRKKLLKGEPMADLARAFSTAPEAENGGEVGWFSRGELHESMAGPLFSSETGSITPVVRTPYGYHIFEVLERSPAVTRALPEVYGRIESELHARKKDARWHQWVSDLKNRYRVEVDREKLRELETGFDER